MKIKYCLIFSFILQLTLFSQVIWQSKNPLPQTDLKSVYFFNTNTGLVCGTGGFIYKTTNAGYSWSYKATATLRNLNSLWFYSAANGIAVGDSGTVIYTTDAGENWSLQSPVTNLNLRKIFFYDNTNVIVICNSGRILKSTNSGTSWNLLNLNVSDLFEIDRSNGNLYIGSTNSKYLKSTDIGSNWQLITPGVSNSIIYQVHFATIDTGYMYTNNYEYYKTTNSGATWNQNNGFYIPQYTIYANSKFGIGVQNYGPIFKTTNGGNNWQEIGPSNSQGSDNYSEFILDTNNIYAVGKGGKIFHHGNGFTNTWNIIGGSVKSCYDISFYNSNIGIIATSDEQTWTTTNSGEKWNIQGLCNNNYFEPPRTFIWSAYYKDSLTIYRTRSDGYAGFGFSGAIEMTENGGLSWYTSLYQVSTEFHKIGSAGNSVLCCAGKIIKSSGGGWTDYLNDTYTNFYDFSFINENTGIVLGDVYPNYIKKIYRTTNNGINWIDQPANINPLNVYLRNSGIGLISCDSGRILRTTNYGLNWTRYNTPSNSYLFSIYMLSDNTAWTVGNQGVMMYTNNGGVNWAIAPSYTTVTLNKIVFTDQNTGFAGGDNGTILKTTNGGLTFVNNGLSEFPSEYRLEQNYPNPFNPVTKINFLTPVNANIKIEIFDVTGKLIGILADKEFQAGKYSVEWNASVYSSGIYFYKMISGEFVETKKMILLK